MKKVEMPTLKPTLHGHQRQVAKAARMLSEAKRPLIYAGGGVIAAEAWEELTAFAERMNIPVTTTLMGLGAFPESKPQSVGMLGIDRKSTRLNSSHVAISYAVFCLKKKI